MGGFKEGTGSGESSFARPRFVADALLSQTLADDIEYLPLEDRQRIGRFRIQEDATRMSSPHKAGWTLLMLILS